ncbi:cytochrome P450 [Hassallia byssoidea VB512170]|uniref:Cytochrome P450 n=1 Tax=Hassallia byssoidea VB512170 TaxID=1304833 RepID=A0A846HEC5_9CYAN|nr:cytochrome P450 [Hassalia byssoidea]NEU75695.1 cytochrome P450 [Hassalia byssoidea VB512170]
MNSQHLNMPARANQQTYDLFASGALVNSYPLFKRMREEDPVHYCESFGYWILTRYRDVEAALRDERLSSNRTALFINQLGSLDVNLIQNFLDLITKIMVEQDPPKHTQLRKLGNQGFTTRALESWRSIIQNTTDRLLDNVQNQGGMDIVSDLSIPLPLFILPEIFGVPETDRANMLEWTMNIGTFWGAPGGSNIEIEEFALHADRAAVQFSALIRQLIEQRRRQPGTDMISLLTVAYLEQGFNFEELPSLCIQILGAGLLTITDMISNGVNALLRHPDQLQKLQQNPALINSAVEEMIRFDTSVPFFFRIAKLDLTIGGKDIPKGSVIALGLGAANHDPQKFDSPSVFNITRSPNEHLGFGSGIHSCLGAVLARMELTICLTTLLRRLPNLRFDPDKQAIPTKHKSLLFKGFDSLPVKF